MGDINLENMIGCGFLLLFAIGELILLVPAVVIGYHIRALLASGDISRIISDESGQWFIAFSIGAIAWFVLVTIKARKHNSQR